MKISVPILFFLMSLLGACEKEDQLTPSMLDVDWMDSLDLGNPIVKDCYDNYRVGLLTRFDLNRDLRYNMSTTEVQKSWENLLPEKLERSSEIDSALTFFQESLLPYFKNDDFIRKYFPRKILFTRKLELKMKQNTICAACNESENNVYEGVGALHSIYSKSSFAFSVNLKEIYFSTNAMEAYKTDNLYIFLCKIFDQHDLYSQLGSDFNLSGLKNYYGKNLFDVFVNEDNGDKKATYTDVQWYWGKGFVSTSAMNAPATSGQQSGKIQINDQFGESYHYKFPDRTMDARMYINQLIFVDRATYETYPEIVKDRFRALMDKFDQWGIDIRAINPVLSELFPEN